MLTFPGATKGCHTRELSFIYYSKTHFNTFYHIILPTHGSVNALRNSGLDFYDTEIYENIRDIYIFVYIGTLLYIFTNRVSCFESYPVKRLGLNLLYQFPSSVQPFLQFYFCIFSIFIIHIVLFLVPDDALSICSLSKSFSDENKSHTLKKMDSY